MRTLTKTLSVACLLALGGCAVDAPGGASGEPCSAEYLARFPGAAECSEDGLGGKGDAWDGVNDPTRIATNFEYRYEELPANGRFEGTAWAASYWPTLQGSSNYRWQGEGVLSPMEKYDVAFHDWTAEGEFSETVPKECGETASDYRRYVDWLGPAASWQATAQNRDRLFDGRDNDDDGEADECGFGEQDGIESWWGLCHAWAPAAILEPEPLHAVEYNGQRFEVADIKALIMTAYDGTVSTGVGGRCNLREVEHDDSGRIIADECRDVNAGAWHVVISNLLGLHGRAFVEDRTFDFQVWNQPLLAYEITAQEEIELGRALELLNSEGEAYPFNADAVKFVEVRMTTDYLIEGHQETRPLGEEGYIRHDHYHYILELDAEGRIIGGEWVGESIDNHPDFLWVPTGPRTGWNRRSNPNVDLDTVRMLIQLSRQDATDEPPVTETGTYVNDVTVAIPDDDEAGARSVIEVNDALMFEQVSVSVDISHSYRGDLVVELEHEGTRVTLHEREGGSADDLVETYTLSDFAGTDSRGAWTLRVSDRANADTGSIESFRLTFIQ